LNLEKKNCEAQTNKKRKRVAYLRAQQQIRDEDAAEHARLDRDLIALGYVKIVNLFIT
jgi:hypothetical protein